MRGRKGIFDCASSEDGATRHWYNGQHQRVLKDEPTGQTVYAYGTAGHNVLGEYRQAAGAGAVQSTEHIYLPTASGPMPVATVIGGQHFAVHADHLNTPRRLTDSASRVRWQWAYSGYGETAAQSLALPTVANVAYNLRYPGQVDDGNGLFYNWHRFYHPASGRYVSADPIGLSGGWNRFAYVGGNPLKFVDPFGLLEVHAIKLPSGNNAGEYRFTLSLVNPTAWEIGDAMANSPISPGKVFGWGKRAYRNQDLLRTSAGLGDVNGSENKIICVGYDPYLKDQFEKAGYTPGLPGGRGTLLTEEQMRSFLTESGEGIPEEVKRLYGWGSLVDRAKARN
jgi:RHS repeat-associated protein